MRCYDMHGGEAAKETTEQFIIATVDTALYAQNLLLRQSPPGLASATSARFAMIRRRRLKFWGCRNRSTLSLVCALVIRRRIPRSSRACQYRCHAEGKRLTEGEAEAIAAYDEDMRTILRQPVGQHQNSGWSDQMAGLLGKEGRPHMLGFLQSQGFITL